MTVPIEQFGMRPRVATLIEVFAVAGFAVELAFLSGLKPMITAQALVVMALVLAVSRGRSGEARWLVTAIYAVKLLVAVWSLRAAGSQILGAAIRASAAVFLCALLWSPNMSRWLRGTAASHNK